LFNFKDKIITFVVVKLLRKILSPFVPLYYVVVFLRNKLYDWSFFKSKSYEFPLICVGNISVGGTGKTPMVEYLVSILNKNHQLAILSRGYGRVSKGFVIAGLQTTSKAIGDEPFQIFNKFKDVIVAVDSDRQNGLELLKQHHPSTDVILLDDAFQHRKVLAGFNILLTAYDHLYCDDYVLPTGNLREPKSGAKRAQLIVVTKCPENLSELDKTAITKRLNPASNQTVFFSSIQYSDTLISSDSSRALADLKGTYFTLVTGIANPTPLVKYLKNLGLDFEHLNYKDHHEFSISELEFIHSKPLVVTTEKDFSRLNPKAHNGLFYLPIQLTIDKAEEFERLVVSYVKRYEA
jgi:tetraacyldisaccharide 4'-kinase